MWALDVAQLIDTSDVKLAVDVGGAHGVLLRELQLVNPALRGIVFPGGRVAIIEFLLDDLVDPGVMALMDVAMLAVAGGRERSLAEFDALLSDAGLRRIAVRRSGSPQSVIEAVAA